MGAFRPAKTYFCVSGKWIYNILIVNEASEYKTDLEIVAIRVWYRSPAVAPPTEDNSRLLEDGDFRLLEDGDYRLLESA